MAVRPARDEWSLLEDSLEEKDETTGPTAPGSEGGPGRTTRRQFLGLAGLAALGLVVESCTPKSATVTTSSPTTSAPTTSTSSGTAAGTGALGPETSAYQAPAQPNRPSPESGVTFLAADVCVVGGGAAGMMAAAAAARQGAKTILVEESWELGGNLTRGLVDFDRAAWGGGLMVGGLFAEFVQGLAARGDAVFPSPRTSYATPSDPDALRSAALAMAQRAGVDVRLGTTAVWALTSGGRITSIWTRENAALSEIAASIFIDCTGDGNLGFLAGHPYWLGDRDTGVIQGQTLIFCAGPVDQTALWDFARAEGSAVDDYRIIGLRSVMRDVRASGEVTGSPQSGMLINRNMWRDIVSVSASETYGNHLEPGGLAGICSTLQTQNAQIHKALVDHIPAFKDSRLIRLAERPYLREGRRLVGNYQLTAADVRDGVKAVDSIARGYYPIDMHLPSGASQTMFQKPGDWYSIPYRCLVASGLDNLLMAGRCISVTHEALGSTRVSPVSTALGHAAGVAAAMAAKARGKPAEIPIGDVQTELLRQGALI